MLNENQLVERTGRRIPSATGAGLRLGIGDDAAIISVRPRAEWVVSCDSFLERVHFLPGATPPDSVGYKSLIRAASDLAAMGATPRLFLMTLALPATRTGAWFDAFLGGMARAARSLGMRLAGGDTTKSRTISISITVLGEVALGRYVTRSGARPGNLIYVSGRLGRAALGLALLRRVGRRDSRLRGLLRPHFYPRVRIDLGRWLAQNRVASAMMDISDGLSTDLARLCAASRAGARIQALHVPTPTIPAVLSSLPHLPKFDPLQLALHGGDDYELLFTVSPKNAKRLRAAPGFAQLTHIGEITRARKILLVAADGTARPLRPLGWDPFRSGK
jgi:thiamine-monophosphate kinase